MEKDARSTFALETHAKFVVPIFQGGDWCDLDGKTRSFYVRIRGCKRSLELLWFEPHFLEKKKRLTHATFVVSVLQEGDL